jgi:hypothetical protein
MDGGLVFVTIRGDLEVNEVKLKNALGCQQLRLATEGEVAAAGFTFIQLDQGDRVESVLGEVVTGSWFPLLGLDALGENWIGEVPKNFRCWPTPPQYHRCGGTQIWDLPHSCIATTKSTRLNCSESVCHKYCDENKESSRPC